MMDYKYLENIGQIILAIFHPQEDQQRHITIHLILHKGQQSVIQIKILKNQH